MSMNVAAQTGYIKKVQLGKMRASYFPSMARLLGKRKYGKH